METLRRYRSGGSQLVRVEHVHVNKGGQAVIGPVIFTQPDISIALSQAGSLIPLEAASCRSQALDLLFKTLSFLVEPCDLRFWHIGATQLIEHLTDGEFVYFSHSKILYNAMWGVAVRP